MQTRSAAIAEVARYIGDHVRSGVNAEQLAAEIVDNDIDSGGQGHGEVRGYYTTSGNPLVVAFEPATEE